MTTRTVTAARALPHLGVAPAVVAGSDLLQRRRSTIGATDVPASRAVIDNDCDKFRVLTTWAPGDKRDKRVATLHSIRPGSRRSYSVSIVPSVSGLPLRVRRFAALDLVGVTGAIGRRGRLVRLEFVASAALGLALGAWLLAGGAPTWFGVWSFGIGVNYVALSAYAIEFLRRPSHLAAELEGVDVRYELRRYSATQLLLVMPFLVAGAAAIQHTVSAFDARTRRHNEPTAMKHQGPYRKG